MKKLAALSILIFASHPIFAAHKKRHTTAHFPPAYLEFKRSIRLMTPEEIVRKNCLYSQHTHFSVLGRVAQLNDPDFMKELLRNPSVKATVNENTGRYDSPAPFYAIAADQYEQIKVLVEEGGADVNYINPGGFTLLTQAIDRKNIKTLKLLAPFASVRTLAQARYFAERLKERGHNTNEARQILEDQIEKNIAKSGCLGRCFIRIAHIF